MTQLLYAWFRFRPVITEAAIIVTVAPATVVLFAWATGCLPIPFPF